MAGKLCRDYSAQLRDGFERFSCSRESVTPAALVDRLVRKTMAQRSPKAQIFRGRAARDAPNALRSRRGDRSTWPCSMATQGNASTRLHLRWIGFS
jgi:hypothetical protein